TYDLTTLKTRDRFHAPAPPDCIARRENSSNSPRHQSELTYTGEMTESSRRVEETASPMEPTKYSLPCRRLSRQMAGLLPVNCASRRPKRCAKLSTHPCGLSNGSLSTCA